MRTRLPCVAPLSQKLWARRQVLRQPKPFAVVQRVGDAQVTTMFGGASQFGARPGTGEGDASGHVENLAALTQSFPRPALSAAPCANSKSGVLFSTDRRDDVARAPWRGKDAGYTRAGQTVLPQE